MIFNLFMGVKAGILAKVDGDIQSKSRPAHYVIYFTKTVMLHTMLCMYVMSQLRNCSTHEIDIILVILRNKQAVFPFYGMDKNHLNHPHSLN